MVFLEDVAGRGVTYYNIGGKKLINVFRGKRPDVMCCASADDGRRNIFVPKPHILFLSVQILPRILGIYRWQGTAVHTNAKFAITY
jgi:hypothetical protein